MPNTLIPGPAGPSRNPVSAPVAANPPAVTATRLVRKMRGRSQAHLVVADDRKAHVVKFSNNPRHTRCLVNEMLVSTLLAHLEISTPASGTILITETFLRENPDVWLQVGTERRTVVPGVHFRSSYPGDPERDAVYDLLPDSLLGQVANASHFLGALVADKWMAKADARQSIFVRAPRERFDSPNTRFVAQMIGHGSAFGGTQWQFVDSATGGQYARAGVYPRGATLAAFAPWLDRVACFPEQTLNSARERIPEEWLGGDDQSRLQNMLEALFLRRKNVGDLVGKFLERRRMSDVATA
jgi:hypothetical protein